MNPVWFGPELADEIIKNNGLLEKTQSVVSDILAERLDIARLVENMAGVLVSKEAAHREQGMCFLTKILCQLPKQFLNESQIKFISIFYIDRLKDNHRVIPHVIEGYLVLIDMTNYDVQMSRQFFLMLFREVACQTQLRQDRYHIYLIIQKLMDKNVEFIKSLGADFVYGVISAMDGERDPRNLLFLFSFLPRLISQVQLGHLTQEMFDVISCYYPIDFHPNLGDPVIVTRQDLADALCPCLCALPAFGEQCLLLLIEKLDSSLVMAKLDSFKLLIESCKTFSAETYGPFLKSLWASIHRETSYKSEESLKIAAHEALSALVNKLSSTANTDRAFEAFVEGIIISMQTLIAETSMVVQFIQATKVLLTTARASKESCIIVTGTMIPATIRYYSFKTTPKIQICSLEFLGDLYDLAKHWDILDTIQTQLVDIPPQCLVAVSEPKKEYQITGFKTLMRVIDVVDESLVAALLDVLCHNVQFSHDNDVLITSIETVHCLAKKYPELVMSLVIREKCDLNNLTKNKTALQKRLNLLSTLLSIEDFTRVIVEEMLKLIAIKDEEASKVIEALSESMSNSSFYTDQKVTQIESDHSLINSVVNWLMNEIETTSQEALSHGYTLISNTMSSLPKEKQLECLNHHSQIILGKCNEKEIYFLILESLYNAVLQDVHNNYYADILSLSLKLSMTSNNPLIRMKSCALVAHFLNKANYGPNFELLYESLKSYLASCLEKAEIDDTACSKLIILYGWITKALLMRGSDMFRFWLQKITSILTNAEFCKHGAEAIRLIMQSESNYLTTRHHCRTSLLYKQRMFLSFSDLVQDFEVVAETKECYLLSWSYVISKTPISVLIAQISKVAPLVIESLQYDNKELLLDMLGVLCHFVQSAETEISSSLQTILPRVVRLTKYSKSMDVRIKALQCLHDIGDAYRTALLLPFKADILLDLAPSLDDKKRLVRNVAVKARTRWFLIGAPGEAKPN